MHKTDAYLDFNYTGKLVALLTKGKALDKDKEANIAWRKMLGAESLPDSYFFQHVAQFSELVSNTFAELEGHFGKDKKLYSDTIIRINDIVEANLKNTSQLWGHFINAINDDALVVLRHCSRDIAVNNKEETIPSNEAISEIGTLIGEAIKIVSEENIPDEIKADLSTALLDVGDGIKSYQQYFSKAPILKAINGLVEKAYYYSTVAGQYHEELKRSKVYDIVIKLKALFGALSFANKHFQTWTKMLGI